MTGFDDDKSGALRPAPRAEDLPCDYCGGGPLVWRKCKLICEQCRQINKSCADL